MCSARGSGLRACAPTVGRASNCSNTFRRAMAALIRKRRAANDLYSWQTKLVVPDANKAAQVLREQKYRFVSSGVCHFQCRRWRPSKSFLVRDPDGHVMQLIEK